MKVLFYFLLVFLASACLVFASTSVNEELHYLCKDVFDGNCDRLLDQCVPENQNRFLELVRKACTEDSVTLTQLTSLFPDSFHDVSILQKFLLKAYLADKVLRLQNQSKALIGINDPLDLSIKFRFMSKLTLTGMAFYCLATGDIIARIKNDSMASTAHKPAWYEELSSLEMARAAADDEIIAGFQQYAIARAIETFEDEMRGRNEVRALQAAAELQQQKLKTIVVIVLAVLGVVSIASYLIYKRRVRNQGKAFQEKSIFKI